MTVRYLVGDVFERMAQLPDGSVDLVLTSPPFLALRSYLPPGHPDKAKEIGSEATPAEFLDTLLAVTAEWRRLLAPHGSICVELGDTFTGSGGAGGDYTDTGLRAGQEKFAGSAIQHRRTAVRNRECGRDGGAGWPLDKSLALIPGLYAACLAYGRNLLTGQESPAGMWRVRNLVAWVRPNPPVGALADKFRPATSYLIVACTARDRWFDLDAVRTPASTNTHPRIAKGGQPRYDLPSQQRDGNWKTLAATNDTNPAGSPPLDWWCIPPGGYQGAHYAVWPPELLDRPVESMCPRRVCRTCGQPSRRIVGPFTLDSYRSTTAQRNSTWTTCGCPGTDGIRPDGYHTGAGWRPGHILDPFAGSGTTAVVAHGHGRDCTLIDLDARNVDLARERLGMFLDEVDQPAREVPA